MSTTFQLKSGADTFDFDLSGGVTKGGAAAGKWTTNQTNQIVLTQTDGSVVNFTVVWAFDGDNHLVLQSGGAAVFDFSSNGLQIYKTVGAVLNVQPDSGKAFNFQIRGTWDIDTDHNLTFTVSGQKSTISGFVQDPRGRFMYHFFNQKDLTQESIFGFVGDWTSIVDATGKPLLQFQYKLEDGTTGTFKLPAAAAFNTSLNQFMYEYDKAGQTFRIQFVGELTIDENFQITYSLDRQVSKGTQQVGATTFKLGAVFKRNDFTGEMQLAIAKNDGSAGSTTITLGGNFTALLGTTKLVAGFSFSQVRNGAVVTNTVGFNGSLTFQNNGSVTWDFQKNATQLSIDVRAQIQLGPARVEGRLNLVSSNGKVVGVRALLGVAF